MIFSLKLPGGLLNLFQCTGESKSSNFKLGISLRSKKAPKQDMLFMPGKISQHGSWYHQFVGLVYFEKSINGWSGFTVLIAKAKLP